MKKGELLYSGKAKSVFLTDQDDYLILEFRDDTSAFDGKKVEKLPRKGSTNNRFNAHIMRLLSQQGIPTHFQSMLSPNESIVKRLEMLPLECVVRNRASGSLCRRLGVEQGLVLDPPVFEFFLKNDVLGDPMVNESHIATFSWATPIQVDRMKALTSEVNTILSKLFADAGMILVDYKLEFGLFGDDIVLGDEFSPDGCRIWDQQTGEKLDKDRFRQDLGNVVESYELVAKRLDL